jgi:hypothetical protein
VNEDAPKNMGSIVPCFSAESWLFMRIWLGFKGGSWYSLKASCFGAVAISSLGMSVTIFVSL